MMFRDPALVESGLDICGSGLDFDRSSRTDTLRLGEHGDNPGLVGDVSTGGDEAEDEDVEEKDLRIQQASWRFRNRDGAVESGILHGLSVLLNRKQHTELQDDILSMHVRHERVRNVGGTRGRNLGALLGDRQVTKDYGTIVLSKLTAHGLNHNRVSLVVGNFDIDTGDFAVYDSDPQGRVVVWEGHGNFGIQVVRLSGRWGVARWRVGSQDGAGEQGDEREGGEEAHCGGRDGRVPIEWLPVGVKWEGNGVEAEDEDEVEFGFGNTTEARMS